MNNYSPAGYVGLLTILSERARKLGYALGLHGSLSNDMDLLAVAWTEWAVPPPDLVAELAKVIVIDPVTSINGPEEKPHGRLAWTLALGAGARIDLSVMAPNQVEAHWKSNYERAQSLLEEAREDNRIKADALDMKREEIRKLRASLNETDVRAGTAQRALAVEKHETYVLRDKCTRTELKLKEALEQISILNDEALKLREGRGELLEKIGRLEKVLSGEALIQHMLYTPGQEMNISLSHPMQASLVAGFADMLDQSKAENYIEMRMTKGEQKIVVTIQREEKPTPHELRKKAEAENVQLLTERMEWRGLLQNCADSATPKYLDNWAVDPLKSRLLYLAGWAKRLLEENK